MDIPESSDMFSFEWLKIFSDKYGKENVCIAMTEKGTLSIKVNTNENRSS